MFLNGNNNATNINYANTGVNITKMGQSRQTCRVHIQQYVDIILILRQTMQNCVGKVS